MEDSNQPKSKLKQASDISPPQDEVSGEPEKPKETVEPKPDLSIKTVQYVTSFASEWTDRTQPESSESDPDLGDSGRDNPRR